LGAALILAPYALVEWLIGLSNLTKGSLLALSATVAINGLWFLTAIVGVTYLTRLALRADQSLARPPTSS